MHFKYGDSIFGSGSLWYFWGSVTTGFPAIDIFPRHLSQPAVRDRMPAFGDQTGWLPWKQLVPGTGTTPHFKNHLLPMAHLQCPAWGEAFSAEFCSVVAEEFIPHWNLHAIGVGYLGVGKILLVDSVGYFCMTWSWVGGSQLAWRLMCEWSDVLLMCEFSYVLIALESSDNVRERPCLFCQGLHNNLQDTVWRFARFSSFYKKTKYNQKRLDHFGDSVPCDINPNFPTPPWVWIQRGQFGACKHKFGISTTTLLKWSFLLDFSDISAPHRLSRLNWHPQPPSPILSILGLLKYGLLKRKQDAPLTTESSGIAQGAALGEEPALMNHHCF